MTSICCAAILFFTISACEYEEPTFDLEIEDTELEAVTFTLWADQNFNAGTVTVSNDLEYLYITISSTAGFQDTKDNVRIWLGADITKLPTNKSGVPIHESFPYKYTLTLEDTNHTFEILLTDINNWYPVKGAFPQELSILVYGDVLTIHGDKTSGKSALAQNITSDSSRRQY